MTLADLLANAAMLAAPQDATGLAPLRALLFGLLRASGWTPAGPTRGAPHAAESDAMLLAAFVRGEAVAFDILFDRHAARLNGHARRWLQGAAAADVVQETFLVLFQKASSVLEREEVNVGGFLFGTLNNKVRHSLACAAREVPVPSSDTNEAAVDDDGLTTLLRREDTARLADLLERTCNPLEQDVMLLDLEDRDDAEIATALDVKPGHVRVLRHRARQKLRGALERANEEASS